MNEVKMTELKQMPIWVLWKRQTQNGKTAKVPMATNGKACGTSETYQNQWKTFSEAETAQKTKKTDGVGFVIPPGMFFLDIDHKKISDPLVQEMLQKFDSYSEFSVSGEGIHIYGLYDVTQLPTETNPKNGKLKLSKEFYTHNDANGLEFYIGDLTSRFAAFTEKVIQNKPLRDCTTAVLDMLNRYMRKKEVQSDLDKKTEKIIRELRNQKNGDKFSQIFDTGRWNTAVSPSNLDAALCALIAFRAGEDVDLIDAIFRKSALYREKWEREEYRNSTIEYGIALCQKMKKRKKEIPPFINIDEKGRESISAPLLAKYAREHLPYLLVRDNGNQAMRKYVYQNGVYVLYDTAMLQGEIKRFISEYKEELVKMNVVKEVVQILLSDLNFFSQEDLNADETCINFQNGLLKLEGDTVTLLPHSPDLLSTIQIPCQWKEESIPTPVFDQYLNTLANGDEAIKQLLLEFMGVCISNVHGWRMKKALFLVGDGNTGKSQLKSLTERLLGKGNYIGIDLSEIEARFGTGAIYGTRLAGSSDMSFLSVNELKTFKKITGGDSLFAEFKGQQPFEFVYGGVLWFCMNRLPKFSGDMGQWVYDRIMVVDCPNVIPSEQQDKQLLDKMYAEKEGIVQKCVRALQDVIRNGYRFSESEKIREARSQYQAANSTVLTFAAECLCPWLNGTVNDLNCTTGMIYRVYSAWCKDNNNGYAKSAKEFRNELAVSCGKSFAEMTTRRNGNTYYKEFTLTKDCQKDYGYLLQ